MKRRASNASQVEPKRTRSWVANNVNQITQNFPFELWHSIFQMAAFPKLPYHQLLALRTVCTVWNKVICTFSKIATEKWPEWSCPNPSKLLKVFPLLRSLKLGLNPRVPKQDLSLFTGLKELKIYDPTPWESSTKKARYSRGMTEFTCLTNLSKLTLSSQFITSLGPLTSISSLMLHLPCEMERSEYENLPNLTLVSGDLGEFYDWTGKGDWEKGRITGRGTLWMAGTRAEGTFVGGRLEGEGKFLTTQSHISNYCGGFKAGFYHGHGVLETPHSVYVGEFEAGQYHGKGTVTDRLNNITYSGSFEGGIFHGDGWFTVGGSTIAGNFDLNIKEGGLTGRFVCSGKKYALTALKSQKPTWVELKDEEDENQK